MSSPTGARDRGIALPRDWSSLRELRQARGLSQTQLAELSGVSERTVRAIERGAVERPQHESLRRIAAVLAYGESHRKRLVERWTGTAASRTPDEVAMPGVDYEAIDARVTWRSPETGGQTSSTVCDLTIGVDRAPLQARYLQVHDAMSPSGPPVIWKMSGGLPFDLSTVRFRVATGGVVDDFFVHDHVAAIAIRPDPLLARNPFVIETYEDYAEAVRIGDPVEREWMYGCHSPLRMAAMIVRFTGPTPTRVWSVWGPTTATAERAANLSVGPDGVAQACFYDTVGVFGIQWEWGDETG